MPTRSSLALADALRLTRPHGSPLAYDLAEQRAACLQLLAAASAAETTAEGPEAQFAAFAGRVRADAALTATASGKLHRALADGRPRFDVFVETVQTAVPPCPPDQLHYAVSVFLRELACGNRRKELESYFGKIKNAHFARMLTQARALHAWRDRLREEFADALQVEAELNLPSVTVEEEAEDKRAPTCGLSPILYATLQQRREAELRDTPPESAVSTTITKSSTTPTTQRTAPWAFSRSWVLGECRKYPIMPAEDLADRLVTLLDSRQSSEELQNEFFSLIGFEAFEFIGQLLQNRRAIVQRAKHVPAPSMPTSSGGKNATNVTVRKSKAEVEAHKQERKFERMTERSNVEELASMFGGGGGSGRGLVLPSGAKREMHSSGHYEQVFVPPVFPRPIEASEVVPTSRFSPLAQRAFKGIEALNRIQSATFSAAYNSNENLLICAPTGAGKTNVAMMAVVHEIEQHVVDGVLQRDLFKIVYVAPMKALAQEVTAKFGRRLRPLGIVVRELTGDTQLTKRELANTQVIVTTPEKWDVITRKSGDGSLMALVRLLIIDEVHLLHEDRGPVLEILVARTLRHVETSQQMCRIVGLSATLPNYKDVALFLRVNFETGLHFFGNEYRPVPLTQYYVGVKGENKWKVKRKMQDIALDKARKSIENEDQVMIFVHSRRDTVVTGQTIVEEVGQEWSMTESPLWGKYVKKIANSRNSELRELLRAGLGCHHAGMLRSDRALVEAMFADGLIRCLCTTATLAWGVNLPAHTVIIKGTQVYDSKRGGFVELSMLDVMQIFGRAGRPQFDTHGEGTIITEHGSLNHYLRLLNQAMPIESQFIQALPDHLNAEIILGTVTNMAEAMAWLSYTYLYVRMARNPLRYGIAPDDRAVDPTMHLRRMEVLEGATDALRECRMVRYDKRSGNFFSTDVGRVASHYYIHHESVRMYNERLKPDIDDAGIFHLLSQSKEFAQIKVRDEEVSALHKLAGKFCPVLLKSPPDSQLGKVNVLLQNYISQGYVESPTLISDSYYIAQSAGRLSRALFEMTRRAGKSGLADRLLRLSKEFDRRMWHFQHPLRQFLGVKQHQIAKLEEAGLTIDRLLDMEPAEVGEAVRQQAAGDRILRYVNAIPFLDVRSEVFPITRDVIRIVLHVFPTFEWRSKIHGSVEPFYLWVQDGETDYIYHTEYMLLHQRQVERAHRMTDEELVQSADYRLEFNIPVRYPVPAQYFVHVISDRWIGSEQVVSVSFQHLIMPEEHPPHTELLPLRPVPVTSLYDETAQRLYPFTHFNPIQTQAFHTLYHSDESVLMGAPTGSGKTIIGELAILRLFRDHPGAKCVYVAPMKALARERIVGWNRDSSFRGILGKRVVELTGDSAPDARALNAADIIITTPEKWDGVSRQWATRGFVRKIGLVVIDEIHLLGQDRGPILEVIVSRMRFIATHTKRSVRIVGLSTALSNARDLADWLGTSHRGFFNFSPDVRPVPLTVHISGYPGKHYCPRMQSMNKPTYGAITTYSPNKPVLVFVSSRRQTRLTALDLISYSAGDGNPHKFLRISHEELESYVRRVRDKHLKHMLMFGIGMHHAGLPMSDRRIVEELFVSQSILVLVCTSTLAWGVNFPAHLVVVKGTEYFDAKTGRYVDFPITDVLQMMGRAGRPQFDDSGQACVLVHEPKKDFYKKFLHSPFPVESSLHREDNLHNTINAEVVAGTIASVRDVVEYLSWTFYFRRLLGNPSYYGLPDATTGSVNRHLLELARRVLLELAATECVAVLMLPGHEPVAWVKFVPEPEKLDHVAIKPTSLGKIASQYYIKYKTVGLFHAHLKAESTLRDMLNVLCQSHEYDELPVRHNEDGQNAQLDAACRWRVRERDAADTSRFEHDFESPHTKAYLLFQAHFGRIRLPITDYITDTISCVDQSMRIIQALIDMCVSAGWLQPALYTMRLMQMIVQAFWHDDCSFANLPHMSEELQASFTKLHGVRSLADFARLSRGAIAKTAKQAGRLSERQIDALLQAAGTLPNVQVQVQVAIDGGSSTSAVEATGPRGAEVGVTLSMARCGRMTARALAPQFSKPKDEGWFVVVSCGARLLSMRRVSGNRARRTISVPFDAPLQTGTHEYTVALVSDAYLGVDQSFGFKLHITEP